VAPLARCAPSMINSTPMRCQCVEEVRSVTFAWAAR
jgi:hypothetical protein